MSALIYSLKRPWWIFYCVSCSGFFLFCFVLVFFSDVGIFHQLVVNTHAFVWNSRILTGKSVFSMRLKEMFKLKKAGDFKVCSIFCENLTSWRDYLPFITRYNHSFRTEADFNVPNCIFDVKLTSKKNNNKIKKTFSSDTSKELLVGLQTIHSWAGCELYDYKHASSHDGIITIGSWNKDWRWANIKKGNVSKENIFPT